MAFPWALVQSNSSNAGGGLVTSLAVAFTSNVTKGDLLIAIISSGNPQVGDILSVTDSQGNSWAVAASTSDPFVTSTETEIWWAVAGSTGANTVTAHCNACHAMTVIGEYNIPNPTVDQTTGLNQNFTVPAHAITTGFTDELIICGATDGLKYTTGWSINQSFVRDAQQNDAGFNSCQALFSLNAATTITTTPSPTHDGGTLTVIPAQVSFKPGALPPSIGKTRYGVNVLLDPQPANTIPYRLCVNNNRLYCVLPDFNGIFSCFVYYLGRENNQGGYWYRYVIDPSALFSEEDGTLFGGFGDGGVGDVFTLDVSNVLQFAGTNINVNLLFPMSKNDVNQRKDTYHLRFHIDTGNSPLTLTGYTDFSASTAFALGTITTNGVQEVNLLIQNTAFNLTKRMTVGLSGAVPFFKMIDWSIDYDARPEPISFLRIATNYNLASKKRLRTIPIVIDTRGNAVGINVVVDGVAYGVQNFTTNERVTVFYYFNTDVFATDIIINITAGAGNVFEFYDAPSPVNVETLPVGKLFDQIGPVELERIGALLEFRVRMLATTNSITYNVFMDDVEVVTAQPLPVTANVDKTYGPIKMPKGIQGSVCRIEFLSSSGVFYRWNCKLKFTTGGTKSDTKQVTISDPQVGRQN